MRNVWIAALWAALLLGIGPSAMAAHHPIVASLGDATLVLEDETTALNLFNLGNPAAAAFLPPRNRVDFLLGIDQAVYETEFVTGYLRVVTTTAEDTYLYGEYVDPLGNTLLPNAVYTRKTRRFGVSYNTWDDTQYGGVLAWLNPNTVIQVIPLITYVRTLSDEAAQTTEAQGGAKFRLAWQPRNDLAVGGTFGFQKGENQLLSSDLEVDPFLSLSTQLFSEVQVSRRWLYADLGIAYRLPAIFEDEDWLNLGLTFHGSEDCWHQVHDFYPNSLLPESASGIADFTRMPWDAQLQAVYYYQSRMDVGLLINYEAEKQYLAWEADALGLEQDRSTISSLSNLNYQLEFRVRLPMVREDDLRFGVNFSNAPKGHVFPTGTLHSIDLVNYSELPEITTASSGIGIGMSLVPQEGSIVALDYRIGSSKSRQFDEVTREQEITGDSGYSNFAFGVQYQLVEGLFLRLAYTNERLSYQSAIQKFDFDSNAYEPFTLTQVMETNSFRLGLGIHDGPFRIDLASILSRVAYSPEGWTLWDKPVDLTDMNKDEDVRLSTWLSFTWLP